MLRGRNGFDACGAVPGRVLGNGADRDEMRQCRPRRSRCVLLGGGEPRQRQRSGGFGRDHVRTAKQSLQLLPRQQTDFRKARAEAGGGVGGTAVCHLSDQVAGPAVLA